MMLDLELKIFYNVKLKHLEELSKEIQQQSSTTPNYLESSLAAVEMYEV